MDGEPLVAPDEFTAEWLEHVLERRARTGHPPPRVESIDVEPIEASNGRVARLRVRYRRPPPPGERWLERLVVKHCPAGHDFVSDSELAYYAEDYVGLERAPLVPFVGGFVEEGAADENAGRVSDEYGGDAVRTSANAKAAGTGAGYLVVLGDLGERYRDNRLVRPTAVHARALGEALARLHAHRWHDADAARESPSLLAAFERHLAHVRGGLEPVVACLGDALTAERRAWLDEAFGTGAERLRERLADPRGVTLLHGDPNPTNVLTPLAGEDRPPAGGLPLYLIDRQPFGHSMQVGLAALDLVLAAVPYWTPDERRALEPVLLDGYHETLRRAGIESFERRRLDEDYRLCLTFAVHVGVEWGTDAADLRDMRWLWEAQLERAWCAMRDHPAPSADGLTG